MAWGTTADLVSAVRLRAARPDASADGALSNTDILSLANEEVAFRMVPLLRSVREEYWVTYDDYLIASSTDSRFRIPGRAQGSGLRDVTVRDSSSGREWSIPRLPLEEIGRAENGGAYIYGDRRAFVLEGDEIVLLPTTGGSYSGDTLRVRYERRHPLLVETSAATQVVITGSAGAWTFTPQGNWSDTLDGAFVCDVLAYQPQYGPWATDAPVGPITGGTSSPETCTSQADFTSANGVPANGAAYGSWVSLPDTSPVVQMPYEVWPLLVSCVVSRVLEVVGDRDGAALAQAKYQQERQNVLTLLEPRVEGELPRIVNTASHLRSGGRWWR